MSTQTKHEERKKRIILIGRSTAGKTTLCQRINNEELRYYKTQTVQVINQNMIDTPGEYLERRGFRGALVVTSADADIILMADFKIRSPIFGNSGFFGGCSRRCFAACFRENRVSAL